MTLLRLHPFGEFTPLHRELDRFLGGLVDRVEQPISRFVPAAELEILPEQFYLSLELPGVDPDKIEVTETATGKRSEFRYGKFARTIDLPEDIQPEAVAAKYDRGVLHLTIPKTPVEKNKVVAVKVAA
jgi:HSP20 family protein